MGSIKVLCIGDIVGSPGRRAMTELLPKVIKEYSIDFVVANAENASGGKGITPANAIELFNVGVDVITGGDHVWDKKEMIEGILELENVLRPLNFPENNPGKGYYLTTKNGTTYLTIHLVCRVFMRHTADCPFRIVDQFLSGLKQRPDITIVDVHGEATSEKSAMGWFLDGRASVVFGTHTHIPTADETILTNGTAYITDIGMTGPYRSVIGRDISMTIHMFKTQMPTKLEVAGEDIRLYGFLVEVDKETGKAVKVEKIISRLGK